MAKDKPGDEQAAPRRRGPTPDSVKERVQKFLRADEPPVTEGVAQLNPGFFMLQRMQGK